MPTTSDYLTQLQTDMATLKTNVASKGVAVSENDNFTTLSSKVADIQQGGSSVTIDNCDNLFEINNRIDEVENILPLCSGCSSMFAMFRDSDAITSLAFNNFDASSVLNMQEMFMGCCTMDTLDISSFITTNVENTTSMFEGCTALLFLDMRNFTFDNLEYFDGMFGTDENSGVPSNCEIIVGTQTEKNWIETNFSWLTNVKTVAEYEAQ